VIASFERAHRYTCSDHAVREYGWRLQ
jgi:hypothetical protein